MQVVRFGFAFKMDDKEFITLYSPENNAKITDGANSAFVNSISIKHIICRGERAGMMDEHRINFDDDTVTVVNRRGVMYRLVSVYCDDKPKVSDTDALIASLTAERRKAKEEMDAVSAALKAAQAKYYRIVKDGDVKLLALLSDRLVKTAI